MPTRRAILALAALGFVAAMATPKAKATTRPLLLGSTTTTDNSGFTAYILPLFEADASVSVRVVVGGTGRILKLLADGDLDAALTHYPEGEERLVAAGGAGARIPVMENDFLIAGPAADPAGVRDAASAAEALALIAATKAPFLSRGDDSGTHAMERALWATRPGQGRDAPGWYRETGAGMGATLNIAAAMGGYALVDRATWATFANPQGLTALFEDPHAMRNVYSILTPSAAHAHADRPGAAALADWFASERGRAAISAFRRDGRPLFRPIR